MPLNKAELELIKADLGVNSRRLMQLYNDNLDTEQSSDLCEAAQKSDSAYEAMKSVLQSLE